jgi:hypothetical protein
MAENVKVRVGLQSARELEFEVADGEVVAAELEAAIDSGSGLVWITDTKGERHGIAVGKVAFVEVEGGATRPGIGFFPHE